MMAVDWEQEHAYMAQALPTPTDTPYRTPSSSVSRLSARRRGSSPGPSSSPPPFSPEDHPDGEVNEDAMDPMNDEGISPLDPRRFTPTLHASLVSEILSLRRDLEGKSRIIDTLEVNLESSKSEAESLNETLSKHAKENRSLKRQLQLLEGGSMSAMTELSRERDEAVENVSDVKKRLEQSQKKNRSQEEEIHKTQILWDDDRQRWDEERRNLERKVHVVEGRLKVVLNEVAAAQAAGSFNRNPDAENDSLRDGAITRASDTTSLRSNSVLDRRRTSTASIGTYDGDGHNQRYSMLSLANGHGPKPEGLNLADELAFDEEEETDDEQDDERPETRSTMTDERPISVQSHAFEMNARKAVAVSLQGTQHFGPPALVDELRNLDSGHGSKTPKAPIFEYRDVGIQYTPPPSPKLHPETQTDDPHQEDITKPLTEEPSEDHTSVPENDTSMQDETAQHSAESSTETVPVDMVSSACQTTSELPSPPWTPKLEQSVTDYAPLDDSKAVTTQSSSTQTEDIVIVDKESEKEERPESPTQIPIPMIAIHPPGSNPPSPRNSVVLPPQTKSVSSQTDLPPRTEMCSSAMQTEEIRIDKRPTKLPSSLLPSALPDEPEGHDSPEISSQPPLPPYYAPPPKSARRKLRDPPPVNPPSNSSKGKEPEKIQAYPGNNDNGPLTENIEIKSEIRRPFRSSSLFAGFEQLSDDEWPDVSEEMFGDDEMLNRPMASYTLRSGKMVSRKPSSTVDESPLEEVDEQQHSPKSTTSKDQVASGSLQRTVARDRPSGKSAPRPLKLATSSKQPDIRRAAMISSSTAAHQSFRPRSPSAPSIGSLGSSNAPPQPQPPFPVPVRLSSRKIGASASEGAQSPTPYGSGQFSERMNGPRGRRPALRKVRSAAVVSRTNEPGRQRSRSPPTLSPSSAAPDSPLAPPMPFDEITAPRVKRSQQMRSSRPPLPKTYSTYSQSREEESNVASTQQTSVVDAIAQTMVGEWMWKYVRRRKSFGMPENNKDGWDMGRTTEEVSANITGNGVRHKRWVWLAPYERAVMWSSKQPTSGSALMGKSGRKLVIQSVLDVKDDNPMPKGALPQNQFNRSILILTPQRALKFTALTQERHFIWLTALSFLSHSSMSFNDLAALPPVPSEDYNPPPPAASLRRNPIRDSIRVAKGKNRPGPSSTRSFTAHPTSVREHPLDEDANESINDAADPPCVPRFSNNRTHTHTRKRSNTAPRLPPSAFRNFAQHAPAPSTYSTTTAGSSDLHSPTSTGPPGITSGRSSMSHRTSEASGPSNVGMTNFFDAVGTVRMEAFVDRTEMMPPRHQSRSGHRGRNGVNGSSRKKENGYMPYSSDHDYYRPDDASDVFYRHDDPFRGF